MTLLLDAGVPQCLFLTQLRHHQADKLDRKGELNFLSNSGVVAFWGNVCSNPFSEVRVSLYSPAFCHRRAMSLAGIACNSSLFPPERLARLVERVTARQAYIAQHTLVHQREGPAIAQALPPNVEQSERPVQMRCRLLALSHGRLCRQCH
jgi:hypothetical protein